MCYLLLLNKIKYCQLKMKNNNFSSFFLNSIKVLFFTFYTIYYKILLNLIIIKTNTKKIYSIILNIKTKLKHFLKNIIQKKIVKKNVKKKFVLSILNFNTFCQFAQRINTFTIVLTNGIQRLLTNNMIIIAAIIIIITVDN